MSTATLIRRISASPVIAPSAKRTRIAVTALFAVSGTIFGTWAARIPDVADQVGATVATLGTALFCISLGSLAGMRLAGGLVQRLGTGRTATAAAFAVCLLLVPAGLASGLTQLYVALTLFGLATGAVNVAANSLGVELEHRMRRPVMSSLHAGFSLGGLTGALAGGLLAGFTPVPVYFVLVALAGLGVTATIAPTLRTPAGPTGERAPAGGAPRRGLVVLLGVIAGCTAFGEGALSDWGALHLRENLHATASVAAAGYAAFSLAMAIGRLAGTRWIVRHGDTRVLLAGTTLAAAGMTTALLTSSPSTAIAGFAVVGIGLANVFPLAIGRAGVLGGAKGIALAGMVGYTGLLGGPPLIGFVAGAIGLPAALATVPLLSLTAGALALALSLELPAAQSVAATLRARARATTRQHGTDLTLLLEGTR